MDKINAAVTDLLNAGLRWPDHRQEADSFSDECRAEIMERLGVDDDTGHQIAVRIWRHLRNEWGKRAWTN